jgi:hypothetical protein
VRWSLLIAFLATLALPPVCLAHGGASQHGYVSTVERIVNANGVEATASGDGHFSFTAPAGRTAIVRGYSDEPYLRFRDGVVEANDLAPTVYVNDDEPVPPKADADADPVWREVARGRSYTWEDERTRWTATEPPPSVNAEPKVPHHIFDWRVDGSVDAKPFSVQGSLEWAPTKSGPGYEWISFLAIGAALLYGAFLLVVRRPAARADAEAASTRGR